MHCPNRTRLSAIALAAVALVAPLAAQTNETPRALIERAAYAEEHQHDLDAAEKLYASAETAARAAGDTATADAAAAARQQVLVRQGKAPAPPQPSPTLDRAMRALLARSAYVDAWTDEAQRAAADLSLYGDAVLPYALAMIDPNDSSGLLRSSGGESWDVIEPNRDFALQLLGTLDSAKARNLLDDVFRSSDPVLRRTVLNSVSEKHTELLRRAAIDPVESIRGRAVSRLLISGDTENGDAMEFNARMGNENARTWMALYQPLRTLSMLDELATQDDHGAWLSVVDTVKGSGQYACDAHTIEVLLHLMREADWASVREAAQLGLSRVIELDGRDGSIDPAVEGALLRDIERDLAVLALKATQRLDATRTVRAVTRGAANGSAVLTDAQAVAISELFGRLNNTDGAVSSEDWRAAFDALAPREVWTSRPNDVRPTCDMITSVLERRFSALPEYAAFLQWFAAMPEQARDRYRGTLLKWVESRVNWSNNAKQPTKVERSIVPVLKDLTQRELAAPKSERKYSDAFYRAYEALADVDFLATVVALAAHFGPTELSVRAGRATAGSNPARATAWIWGTLEPQLKLEKIDNWTSFEAISWLPDEEALALFRRAYAAATTKAARSALDWVLVEKIDTHAANPEMVRLYPSFAADMPSVRNSALLRFTEALYEPAIGLLGEELKSGDEVLRNTARAASEKFREQREALEEFRNWTQTSSEARVAIDELRGLLADKNRDVVIGAVRALGAVKARTALPELVKLLARDDDELKAAVQAAINRIGE